jgi:hypothetical protein
MNEHLTKQCANSHGIDKNMPALQMFDFQPKNFCIHGWLTDFFG